MSVVHVKDVTGVREYKTPNGTHLSPVYYEAVRELHDVLELKDFDALYNWRVSPENTDKVIANIQNLLLKLNNNVLPNSLKLLPEKLYEELKPESYETLILSRPSALLGSQLRKELDKIMSDFSQHISSLIVEAYLLPHYTVDDTNNTQRLLVFAGYSAENAKKETKRLTNIKRSVDSAIASTGAGVIAIPAILGLTVGVGDDLVFVAAFSLLFGPISLLGFNLIALVETTPKVVKGKVKRTFGRKKEDFALAYTLPDTSVKPVLASIESYLLQENKTVDELLLAKRLRKRQRNGRE